MANKNIQIKDLSGNLLFPKTKGSLVYNDNDEALGTVEAGAQVNRIEKIKLNGVELNIVSKEVNIELPVAAEYTIEKQVDPEDGFSATYYLTKDGTKVGETINIPKDMVVQSGSVKVCAEADSPVEGYAVGDKYIDLLLANTDNERIYILVSDLVDTISAADDTITVSNNTVKVNIDELKKTFAEKSTTLEGYGITDAYTKTEVDGAISDAVEGIISGDLSDALKAYAKTADVNAALSLKANQATTYTKTEVDTLIGGFITYDELA